LPRFLEYSLSAREERISQASCMLLLLRMPALNSYTGTVRPLGGTDLHAEERISPISVASNTLVRTFESMKNLRLGETNYNRF